MKRCQEGSGTEAANGRRSWSDHLWMTRRWWSCWCKIDHQRRWIGPPMTQVVSPRMQFCPQKRWERDGEEGSRDERGRGWSRKSKLPPTKGAGENGWGLLEENSLPSQLYKVASHCLAPYTTSLSSGLRACELVLIFFFCIIPN